MPKGLNICLQFQSSGDPISGLGVAGGEHSILRMTAGVTAGRRICKICSVSHLRTKEDVVCSAYPQSCRSRRFLSDHVPRLGAHERDPF